MAVQIEAVSKKFFTQFRNGDTFTDAVGENTPILQGNVGNNMRFEEVVRVTISVNATISTFFDYSDLGGGVGQFFSFGVNFSNQGLVAGQVCDLFQGVSNMDEITILNITGPGNSIVQFDNTAVDPWLFSGFSYDNLVIMVKTVPDYLRYQYGIMPSNVPSNNYTSPIDGTLQSYVQDAVDGSGFKPMPRVGTNGSWDLTDLLEVKFIATIGTYTHEFKIHHQFRPHWYVEEEFGNLEAPVNNPPELYGPATSKYVNGFFFGFGSPTPTAVMEDNFGVIGSGNLGYYEEALNGFTPDFTLVSSSIVNSSGLNTLEVTETNNVTAVINSAAGVFVAGQKVIINHTRCTTEIKSALLPTSSNLVFLIESKSQLEGDPPGSATLISNAVVTVDSPNQITVTYNIDYPLFFPDLIDVGEDYLLWITVDDMAATAITERPVEIIVDFDKYLKNLDQIGRITNYNPRFYNPFNAYGGLRFGTDWKGWDGDIVGVRATFDLLQTTDGTFRNIQGIKSQIIADNGTDQFIIFSKTLNVIDQVVFEDGGYAYVIIDQITPEGVNIPTTEDIAIQRVVSLPPFPPDLQEWTITTIIPRISWRDWVANGSVPSEFFDNTKPNNNLNQKTSNYQSGAWVILHQLEVKVEEKGLTSGVGGGPFTAIIQTTYNLQSDHFDILDFDLDGGTGFSAVTNFYDSLGDLTDNIFSDQTVRVEVEFTHALGVLPIGDICGYIWIERQGGTTEPFQLHTDDDYSTIGGNPLRASDTLSTGNTTVVEVVSALNLVTFICLTNPANIDEGVLYNIYGRIDKKT